MHIATVELEGISPYSQSRPHQTEKLKRGSGSEVETPDDHERRTWRERCNVDDEGYLFIPPMAFKNCLSEIAKYLSMQIPGKGKSTYTKHFESGVMVLDGLRLSIKKQDVEGEWLYVPADGRRGGDRRVFKCFPLVRKWKGKVQFHILDDIITEAVFERHIKDAGSFIGIGRFRPRRNGFYGRFKVNGIKWEHVEG